MESGFLHVLLNGLAECTACIEESATMAPYSASEGFFSKLRQRASTGVADLWQTPRSLSTRLSQGAEYRPAPALAVDDILRAAD